MGIAFLFVKVKFVGEGAVDYGDPCTLISNTPFNRVDPIPAEG